MDYIQIPRSLIYKDRTDLKDFDVQVIETVNQQLFSNLKMLFKATDRAKELILRCFNNAYYICTLVPFEDFPDMQVAEYEKLLLKDDVYDCEEICAVSMAMVCKLLPACNARWRSEDNELINNIYYRFTHYRWMNSGARKSFEFMVEKHNTNGLFLPQSEFAPRDIIEVIETFSVRDLQDYAEYICERLVHLENPRQRMHGADTAIARIKDYQRNLCEETEYNPKKDCFKYADNDSSLRNFTWENQIRDHYQQSKKAIEYYQEHYPKMENSLHEQETDSDLSNSSNAVLVAENEQLRQQLTQRVNEIQELSKENAELKEKLAEFSEPVENLTAEQKVRMAFALELFKAAGLTDEKLEQNKSKVATIMSLLTGISTKKSGTQICQNYLIDKKYYPRKKNMGTLIKLNTLCLDLGINAGLSLESQGNK